jgi:hypothetical protein
MTISTSARFEQTEGSVARAIEASLGGARNSGQRIDPQVEAGVEG